MAINTPAFAKIIAAILPVRNAVLTEIWGRQKLQEKFDQSIYMYIYIYMYSFIIIRYPVHLESAFFQLCS